MHYGTNPQAQSTETRPTGGFTSSELHRLELEVRQSPLNKEPVLEPPQAQFRKRTQEEAALPWLHSSPALQSTTRKVGYASTQFWL